MKNYGFYQKHLQKVSRSFAFCIDRLDGPLKPWVAASYLVCRVLDTIEDSDWGGESHQQMRSFQQFDSFIQAAPTSEKWQKWVDSFPRNIPVQEKQLLAESFELFSHFHSFPENVKEVIQSTVLSMSRGMQHYVLEGQSAPVRIRTRLELNRYCFFVAGVVGELLTRLANLVDPEMQNDSETMVEAYHFGLFLQKVNLLKDQRSDEEEGRFLIYDRMDVYESLAVHAERAMCYIEKIPNKLMHYRLFCSWSAFLALASLPWIERSYMQKSKVKISRLETKTLLVLVESLIEYPKVLRRFYENLASRAGLNLDEVRTQLKSVDQPQEAWFVAAYQGDSLSQADFLEIGVQ
tara:strand:- start:96567 stop:97613 length:1047 start_codon:yes stop_codon:yes gene_type:complete